MLLSLLLHFHTFQESTQLSSHLGLTRSHPTSISVADNDFSTFPNGATHHMFHTIHLTPAVSPGRAEGRNPTNRTVCLKTHIHTLKTPHCILFTSGPIKPKEISTYKKEFTLFCSYVPSRQHAKLQIQSKVRTVI